MTAPSPLRVLSIGEAMVELSPADEGGLWRLGFAGDTLNTAWYLRRLLPPDQPVGYLTRLGRSRFSDALAAFIAQAGLVTDRITRDADREVGLYAIHLDGGERSFSYWRDNSAARRLADDAGALAASLSG
ncbi:PfkB family carbohydrate kinase, partial [Paracoccus endophyticus]|uniref:PfkB family carbohydrate kinase n=1 Tax=Paracoccus endophyticus TaxID=2233774 RepID=UPI001F0C5012